MDDGRVTERMGDSELDTKFNVLAEKAFVIIKGLDLDPLIFRMKVTLLSI